MSIRSFAAVAAAAVAGRDSSAVDRPVFYNTIAWLVLGVIVRVGRCERTYVHRTSYRFLLYVKYTLLAVWYTGC